MKAFANRHNSICVSFFVNTAVLLLVIIFCDMKYEVSDDFVMETILAGGYGNTYDPHLLYSNILIGYFLRFLYNLIPMVSWYFVFHIAVCFFSLVIVGYVILEKIPSKLGWLFLFLFICCFSDDLYILVQFTKTAAAATAAGGVLFLYAFWNNELQKKKKVLLAITGVIQCLIGVMVRDVVRMVIPFLFLIFLKEIWNNRKQGKLLVARVITGVVLCLGIVGGYALLKSYNVNAWQNEEAYSQFRGNNSMRAAVTDVPTGSWDEMQSVYEENGYGIEDYYMTLSWNNLDQSIYDKAAMSNLASINREYSDSIYHDIGKIWEVMKERNYYQMPIVICVRIMIVLLVLFRPRRCPWAFLDTLLTVTLIGYLIYSGKIVYRVEWGLFYCLALNIVWDIGGGGIKRDTIEMHSKWLVLGIAIVLCCKVHLYIPDTSYKTMTDEEYAQYIYDVFNDSWNYKKEKYRAVVSKRQPHKELIELMENDSEHYYLVDFSSGIQMLYYNYKPWIRTEIGYYVDNYSYLGGVTTYFPGCYYAWGENGVDAYNPYRTIASDNVLIVDNLYYETKINYYKQYYNSDATRECVDIVSGYKIWKIND